MSNRTIEAILRLSAKLGNLAAFGTIAGKLDQVDRKAKAFNRSQRAINKAMAAIPVGRYLGGAALAYGAKQAVVQFAAAERRLNRIAVTAGAGKEALSDMFATVDKAAHDYAMSQDSITDGLDALVAAGRELDDALAFLPAVAATAQASGAEIADIATTADAVSGSFDIAAGSMQRAFDILVTAGKLGKFELKDMAQYVPTLAPAFAALGYKGEGGLRKLAAMLQTVRMRTGSAGEAATALQNVIQKMESEETAKKFGKFGVDLRKEMAKARKEGRDLVEVFIELTEKATKGDASKLTQLFTDAQMQVGMRALTQGATDMEKFVDALNSVDGATIEDLNKVLSDTQATVDRLASSWTRVKSAIGGAVAEPASSAMDYLSDNIDYASAVNRGLEKRGVKGFAARTWWGINSTQQQKGLVAYGEGWRSAEGRKAERPRMASPDAGMGWGGPPVPYDPPKPPSVADQYRQYGRGHQSARESGAFPPPRREQFTGGFGSAQELSRALADGGRSAGAEIETAAGALGRSGTEIGSNARASMNPSQIGAEIGAAVAAAIMAKVSGLNINVNARVASAGGVNFNPGRSMPNAGRVGRQGGPD